MQMIPYLFVYIYIYIYRERERELLSFRKLINFETDLYSVQEDFFKKPQPPHS